MKVFKVILILILLIAMNFSVYGTYNQPLTQGEISDWQKSYGEIGKSQTNPDTLLGWFKGLTLDEKVDVYNYWKDKSVNWKENCIRLYPDTSPPDMSKYAN